MARNSLWTGNPVFPEAMKLLGHGEFTEVQVERWERASAPRPEQRTAASRLDALARQVLLGWQFGFLIIPLSLAGVTCAFRSPTAWFCLAILGMLILFWLGFTHLQGRFFILAIPLCGLLVAHIKWSRAIPVGIASVVLAGAGGWIVLNRGIVSYLNGGPGSPMGIGLVSFLGVEQFSPMDSMLQNIPSTAIVVLVGDARAFWYPIPMNRLRYRTVFDVRDGGKADIIRAWEGLTPPPTDSRLIIDPAELRRFHDTYWQIPDLSPWILHNAPKNEHEGFIPFVTNGLWSRSESNGP